MESSRLFREGRLPAREIVRASLDRISAVEPAVHAFVTVEADRALRRARRLDQGRKASRPRGAVLAAVPVGVKDNICTEGIRTTAASLALERFVPPSDATVVRRLRDAGAIVVGKTNCDEFAMGSSTENSAFGPTRNPWALDRVPGGSSGGSAVAVASGAVSIALGSDTGGSVRQPASFCGVVGLKPTYGRVSRSGLIAFASSLDQIGVLSRTVGDAASVLQVIAGHDPADSTSSPDPVPNYTSALTGVVEGLRIGAVPDLSRNAADEEVARLVDDALALLASLGASVTAVELPHARFGVAAYCLIATAEASSNLARYDGIRYGFRASFGRSGPAASDADPSLTLREMYEETRGRSFGTEVKRRIMLGTFALSSGYAERYYLKAQQVRNLIRGDYEKVFEHVDLIVTPTSPTPAFRLGERVDDPLSMYLGDIFTVGPSLAGLPAVSVPCGFTASGLPVGMQIVGPKFGEELVLRVADAYERRTAWHRAAPPVA
ncbi:MAG: Asp-tRNA(Asn)/Glu-tRNA(Gln) amidotransferase subunit GatA [Vicinamibacterales bacterium]